MFITCGSFIIPHYCSHIHSFATHSFATHNVIGVLIQKTHTRTWTHMPFLCRLTHPQCNWCTDFKHTHTHTQDTHTRPHTLVCSPTHVHNTEYQSIQHSIESCSKRHELCASVDGFVGKRQCSVRRRGKNHCQYACPFVPGRTGCFSMFCLAYEECETSVGCGRWISEYCMYIYTVHLCVVSVHECVLSQ